MNPGGEIAVRRAELADLETIIELRLALLREYHAHPLYGRLHPDVAQRARVLYRNQLTAPNEAIFLATMGADVIGVLRCSDMVSSPLFLPDRYCYVSSAYVRPAQRGNGALRALLARASEWCAERGLEEMRLHNAPSTGVAGLAWDALGFEVVEHVRRRSASTPQGAQGEPDKRAR
jgi:GNAT superfamily N-acetyltransferase